jgi:hypothetical protein
MKDAQSAGVEPDAWKIEDLERREDCEELVPARHGLPAKRERTFSWPGHPSLDVPEE